LIFFSISGATKDQATFWSSLLLTVLAILSILVNGVALSAIVFRITEWGFTPNRIAVLGSNVLILIHLILVGVKLIAVLRKKKSMEQVESTLVSFLPYYFAWVCLVIYILPWAFGNR